jgi:hypothetical protein
MTLPTFVDAVQNDRTEKHFIVLDWDVDGDKIKVINPTGDVLDVIKLIFRMNSPAKIQSESFNKVFTAAQLRKLETWESEKLAYDEKKRLEKAARSSQKVGSKAAPKRKTGTARTEGLIDRKQSGHGKRPTVQWSSSELTFYRHHIDKLRTNESFAVIIEGQGVFQISKSEFQRVFNNVIMDSEYRNNGSFRYMEFPEEAKSFLKPL